MAAQAQMAMKPQVCIEVSEVTTTHDQQRLLRRFESTVQRGGNKLRLDLSMDAEPLTVGKRRSLHILKTLVAPAVDCDGIKYVPPYYLSSTQFLLDQRKPIEAGLSQYLNRNLDKISSLKFQRK
jgi:hypothetical protein